MRLSRSIVHLDADAFFASVEQASDPRLRGKPIAVGGEKRGIIASASYEARKFGIYTPMPSVMARRLCPKLILLPGDFEKYELFSRLMFSYAYDFTPDVEIGSIDEGYFDLTGTHKPAVEIAQIIRRAIGQALKLSVSEGVAGNKLVSQIASKLKKPSAFEFVPPNHEGEYLSPLTNKWLPGIGPKAATHLNAAGLALIGQVAQTPIDLLELLVGSRAPELHKFSLGIDERPVVAVRAPAKSYGEQETFVADTTDEEFLESVLRRMADKLMAKVRADGKSIRTLTVKVRYNDMDEEQASESLAEPTDVETETYSKISGLLRKAWRRRVSLRLVSLKLSNVYEGCFRVSLALDASAQHYAAEERLAKTVDELRHKFGRTAVFRGHDFILRRKNGRGEEPAFRRQKREDRTSEQSGARNQGAGLMGRAPGYRGQTGDQFKIHNAKSKTSQTSYTLAVIQRQRIGNSFARVIASPGPELRFRVETTSSNGATPESVASPSRLGNSYVGFPSVCGSRASERALLPLNVHSYYSFLDSTLSVQAIVNLAQRHNLPAIALTDKNNLHGAVEFCQTAAAAGIKPIIGAELDWHGHRLCLYVQDQTGYTNLCRILNAVGQNAPNGKGAQPAADNLLNCTAGLLAVSSCPELAELFPGRFYLEIINVDAFEKRPTAQPCVASLPIHYELPSDRWKYDIVQSIRTLTLLRQPHPEKRLDGDYHFRTCTEMRKLFGAHPELLRHSVEIAERCSFSLALGKPQFPSYPPPDGFTPAAFLRQLVMGGLRQRYPQDHARLKPQLEEELAIITDVGYEEYFLVMWDILQECARRGIEWITRGSAADSLACYCLDISNVCPIRFDLYFRRFLNKDRMALNKLPDIDVDFPHDRKDDVIDLIFEKYGPNHAAIVGGFSTFQSRSAFAEAAKVLGVSEFQVRRLTERLPHFSRASELTEVIPETLECRDLPLDQEPYATALQMARFLDGFPRYPKMHPCGLVLSRQLMHEITPCFISAKGYPTTHFDMDSIEAVGLIKMDILAQGGLSVMRDVMESVRNPQFADGSAHVQRPQFAIGNPQPETSLKEEVSNAQNSSADEAFRTSKRFGFVSQCGLRIADFDLPSPLGPFDDPQVWDLIASGSARAVHHIESPAMISLCKMCNVRDIDTLIAIVSVIRPGAANESKKMEFARRYQGLSPVHYPHASLEPCLRSTYGLVVYEEHILQICEAFAGLPPGRADILRRALAKEKPELIAQIKTEFADCARKRGRSELEITEVWDLVTGFRGYAFCKAHSTAYGVEAYQSAWLKRYYPAEFMAAVLTNGKGFYSPLVYILECHRLGIPLLPPSINNPGPQFTAVLPTQSARSSFSRHRGSVAQTAESAVASQKCIRVPALRVKGLTRRTEDAILRERSCGNFSSLADFVQRVQPLPEEMEALIRAGAFDIFGQTRTAQYWQFKANLVSGLRTGDYTTAQIENQKTQIKHHQLWLLPSADLERLPCVPLSEPSRLERLRAEEELFGYPVSGHPLELFPDIAWDTYCPIRCLGEHISEQIVTCGLVIEQRLFHQVTGEPMKFITIADWTGIIETELFASTYKSYGLSTIRYRVLEITATVEPFENNRGHTLRVLRAGKPRTKPVEQKDRGCITGCKRPSGRGAVAVAGA